MILQLSLCIPTMNRWSFLEINLPKYLQNHYIGEIVITDETGEDFDIIMNVYKDEPKIKIFKNNERLGGFLNKLECMKHASYDWICLIDSDNYADLSYFNEFFSYVFDEEHKLEQNMIYCPSFAKPNFSYKCLQNILINKLSLKSILNSEIKYQLKGSLNTGNYILNRSSVNVIQNMLIHDEEANYLSKFFFPSDTFYMNYLLLKNDYTFVVIPKMEYEHVVHENSFYQTHAIQYQQVMEYIFEKFRKEYK